MTQKELVKAVATSVNAEYKKAGKNTITETNVSDVIGTFADVTKDAVAKGDKIQIAGFGSFEASVRPARTGRNPSTGETIKIEAKTVAKFKPAKAFKELINK
jgi:DNA-binding protein HU-beta